MYYIKLLKCCKPLAHYLAKLLHPNYKELRSVISRKRKQNSGQHIVRWNCCLLLLTLIQEDEASLYPQSFCVPQVSILGTVSWWKSLKRVSKMSKIHNLADVMNHDSSSVIPSQFSFSRTSLFKLKTDLHEAEKSAWHRPCSRTCFAKDAVWLLIRR